MIVYLSCLDISDDSGLMRSDPIGLLGFGALGKAVLLYEREPTGRLFWTFSCPKYVGFNVLHGTLSCFNLQPRDPSLRVDGNIFEKSFIRWSRLCSSVAIPVIRNYD